MKIQLLLAILTILLFFLGILLLFLASENVKKPNTIKKSSISKNYEKKDEKTKKILIFNSFSYQNSELPLYEELTSEITRKYAQKYGYDYKQLSHRTDEMSPYWLRVKDSLDILNNGYYDVIMYLDLDATIKNFDIPIEKIISTGYDMYIGEDPKSFRKEEEKNLSHLINTGCFIIRNTDWSKNFLREWFDLYIQKYSKKWKYQDGTWICEECLWADQNYEQGSLSKMILENKIKERNHIKIFNENVLSNIFYDIDGFVLHLMATDNYTRYYLFQDLLKQVKKN